MECKYIPACNQKALQPLIWGDWLKHHVIARRSSLILSWKLSAWVPQYVNFPYNITSK
jgi:hypothetical protein